MANYIHTSSLYIYVYGNMNVYNSQISYWITVLQDILAQNNGQNLIWDILQFSLEYGSIDILKVL